MRKLFVLVTICYWFSMYIYLPILTPFAEGLGASWHMIGLIVGSYGFTQMLVRIPLGIISDRIGRRVCFIFLGLLLTVLSTLGIGLSLAPEMILVFRALAGVAAATWVIFTVLYVGYFPPGNTAKAMSIIMFHASLGQLLATTLGGFLADRFGAGSTFIVGGLVGCAGLVLSTRIKDAAQAKEPLHLKDLCLVGCNPHLLGVSFLAILAQAINFSTIYGFNQSYAAGLGATDSQLGILMFISALAIVFGSLQSGTLVEKIGAKGLIVISFLLMSLGAGTVPFTKNLLVLYATQALNGYGRGAVFPLLMSLSLAAVAENQHSTAMGFFQAIYGLGMFGGPVLVGYISDWWGMPFGYYFISIIGFVGALAAGKITSRRVAAKHTI